MYREELFNSLENREGAANLPNGWSYMIEGEGIVSLKLNDGTSRKLNRVRNISSFSKNLISLNN